MNINTIKLSALAALVASVLTAPAAHATFASANGDFYIGFRSSTNASNDYLIDIGQENQLRDATAPITFSLPGMSADITTAFGSTANLLWGGIGNSNLPSAGGDPSRTLYLTEPVGDPVPTTSSSQSTQATQIKGMSNYYVNYASNGAQASTGALNLGDTANITSWTSHMANSFNNASYLPIETALTGGLEVYRSINNLAGPVTDLGTLTFDFATSSITFTPVPEPATALMGCALLGTVMVSRRRKTVVA